MNVNDAEGRNLGTMELDRFVQGCLREVATKGREKVGGRDPVSIVEAAGV